MNDKTHKRQTRGQEGELLVSQRLVAQGYRIEALNYEKPYGEVDIIASKNNLLIFVEVKNRHNPLFDLTELITPSKQRKIAAAAKAFLGQYHTAEVTCRFDVALVTQSLEIMYIENAFTHE